MNIYLYLLWCKLIDDRHPIPDDIRCFSFGVTATNASRWYSDWQNSLLLSRNVSGTSAIVFYVHRSSRSQQLMRLHMLSSTRCTAPFNDVTTVAGDNGWPCGGWASLQGTEPSHRRAQGQRQPRLSRRQASGYPDRWVDLSRVFQRYHPHTLTILNGAGVVQHSLSRFLFTFGYPKSIFVSKQCSPST